MYSHIGSDLDLIKAVSGYGRELFFSNIIDYIANHCSEVIASALREFLPPSGFDKVERENRHMDLVFFGRDANQSVPVLVIENKRGSIATEKQLQEYIKKITGNKGSKIGKNSGCSFLLISPHCFDKDVADRAGWSFMLSFQGEVLSIGFFQEGHFDNLDHKQTNERRKDTRRIHNFAEILKQITDRPEGFDDYKGTGYMTSGYILPMYRIDMRDRTVDEIVETMCRYAKGALAYSQNISANP